MHDFDTETHEELRSLRERAYGPAADIDQDPAAAQRLRELEARAAKPAAVAAPAVAVAAPVVTAASVPAPLPAAASAPSEASVEPAADPAPEEAEPDEGTAGTEHPPAPSGTTRLPKVLWALSVVAAAAAAAAVTFSLTFVTPVSEGGLTQIASLEPSAGVEVPPGFIGAGTSARTFEYLGYTIFETTGSFYAPSQSTDCFVLIPTDRIPEDYDPQQGWSYDAQIWGGCRAGSLPGIAQFLIDSGAPEEARARFPDGTALRFVFDGDRVGVFTDSQ